MATLADLTTRTLEILYGVAKVERPTEDTLSGNILSGATSLTPSTTTMWKRGDYAQFSDGEVFIFGADSSGATAVRGAQRGTSAAAHASGSVMEKNPWPLRVDVARRIDEVLLNELWPHVWSWYNGTITYSSGDHLYDLPAYIEDVVTVEQADIDSDGRFHPLPPILWDVERKVASTIATNGTLLRLRHPPDASSTIHYRGKRRPHPDDIANLAEELEAMVTWGAAAKCMAGQYQPAGRDRTRIQGKDSQVQGQGYQLLMGEFLRMRKDYSLTLMGEVAADMRWRPRFRVGW